MGRHLVRVAPGLPNEALIGRLVTEGADPVLAFGADGRVLFGNDAAVRLFGATPPQICDTCLADLLRLEHALDLCALARAGGTREMRARRRDGCEVEVEATLSGACVGGRWLGIALLRDITQRKAHQAELERRALHDALTGLPNRTLLDDRIELALSLARRHEQGMALLLLDLDRFKEINDTLGHQAGDRLLQQIGPRLRSPLRETDTVARLGGDEFAILLPPPTDLATACRVAERIVETLRRPFAVDDLTLEIGVSIGVALHPQSVDAAGLLRAADIAMYNAKRDQLGFVVYDPQAEAGHVRELTLSGELRRAIQGGELSLELQPKVEVCTGRILGVEALVRWHHPVHGAIPPEAFIRSAEQAGLIRPLILWVLTAALEQLQDLRRKGHALTMAIDLSPKSLQDARLPEDLQRLLRKSDVPPELLSLEISESALMADPHGARGVLERIAALGCQLSLDDFGTGYSSLAYLQKLPIGELKIARSLVAAATEDVQAATIVHSIIRLAKALNLQVVAEGVESESAFAWLRTLGCDQVQGHLVGPPMDRRRLLDRLEAAPAKVEAASSRMPDRGPLISAESDRDRGRRRGPDRAP